jgi:hypothetical protein
MDGLMSEDIRIGIMVRTRMRQVQREAEERIYAETGKWPCLSWCRKDGKSVGMSFCSTLMEDAGGIDRLFAEWELR